MSLINDALKRAQDKPVQAPPPDLKFRPVDAKETAPRKTGWLLPSLITAAVLTTIFMVWEFKHGGNEAQQKTAAAASADNSSAGNSLKVHAREQEVAVLPRGLGPVETEKVAVVAVSGTTIQEVGKNQGTNSNLPADGVIAKPSGPRLQAIIFSPPSPSATISGNTVFVGEKVGQWRVAAIGRDSATLIGSGQTNVLKLGE
jgi:hypothetical protein